MGEVIPFKNIGLFVEDITRFLGNNKGSMTLSCKDNGASWIAIVAFEGKSGSVRKDFIGSTFNDSILQAARFVKSAI